MYKILIGTNREAVVRASGMIDWANLDIQAPYLASTSEEAIGLLNTTAIDAVGMSFEGDTGEQLQRFLHTERPSMAIFPISTQPDKQQEYLTELRDMLRHMHTDYVDQALDNESIRVMVRDELVHNLLCGLLTDMDAAERKFKLIRAHLSFTRTCVVYEMDLPQGEIYARRHYNAMDRLERALRNNFFGNDVDMTYYAVAVLAPRHVRVIAIPRGGEEQDPETFVNRADEHVNASLRKINEYLDLDIDIRERKVVPDLKSFFNGEAN